MGQVAVRYAAHKQQLVDAVSGTSGHRVAMANADPVVATYADKVARHAHRVTDVDIEALKRAGYDEDAIFEITVSAAVRAGLARLERGLAALRGEA